MKLLQCLSVIGLLVFVQSVSCVTNPRKIKLSIGKQVPKIRVSPVLSKPAAPVPAPLPIEDEPTLPLPTEDESATPEPIQPEGLLDHTPPVGGDLPEPTAAAEELPESTPKNIPTPKPIQNKNVPKSAESESGEDTLGADFLRNEDGRRVLNKTIQTAVTVFSDPKISGYIINILGGMNKMFDDQDTFKVMDKAITNFNRVMLIEKNVHLADKLLDVGHLAVVDLKRILTDGFDIVNTFCKDPLLKKIALKVAQLTEKVTSEKKLFASGRAVVEQVSDLLTKPKLKSMEQFALAVDTLLTGNKLPSIVLD